MLQAPKPTGMMKPRSQHQRRDDDDKKNGCLNALPRRGISFYFPGKMDVKVIRKAKMEMDVEMDVDVGLRAVGALG